MSKSSRLKSMNLLLVCCFLVLLDLTQVALSVLVRLCMLLVNILQTDPPDIEVS